MRLNRPLDKILNSEIKTRILRIFSQNQGEMSGRQIARMAGVTPKTAHEILQDLLGEGVLVMRSIGKTYLFCLNEDRLVVKDVLRPLFAAENALRKRLFDIIRTTVDRSDLKDEIISVAVFGSIHAGTERPTSDVDLLVIVKNAASKRKAEALFSEIDRQASSQWGNLVSPYINGLIEFKTSARKRTGPVPGILKSYQLIYGDRLEKILR
ncbi:MAG: nucleotidyltransferase domain-containing protein [Candidatus Omnitrophica bacterium]|nr:nucleotidyltransferase domain-containing protein [Candidatus Omnitrophota bacterium]